VAHHFLEHGRREFLVEETLELVEGAVAIQAHAVSSFFSG
jgi:hypothetical protein